MSTRWDAGVNGPKDANSHLKLASESSRKLLYNFNHSKEWSILDISTSDKIRLQLTVVAISMLTSQQRDLRNIMREDVSLVKSLWDHEVERIGLTEAYLVKRWGAVDALQMEDHSPRDRGNEANSRKI